MKKLTNGYALYRETRGRHIVEAKFRGQMEIVFEGLNKKECMAYSHENGMKMVTWSRWYSLATPAFRKVHAKNPVNEAELFIGTVA